MMHWIDNKSSLHSLLFNLLCSINYSGIWFHPFPVPLFFFLSFFFLWQYLEAKILLCMRFCRKIIDCCTYGSRSCSIHKCRASSAFPLPTISIFSLRSYSIQLFYCATFSFLLLDLLLLDLTESHARELYWHSISKPYCILFLSETCPPAWVPLFLTNGNLFPHSWLYPVNLITRCMLLFSFI